MPATATTPFDAQDAPHAVLVTEAGAPTEHTRKIKEAQAFLRTLFADGSARPAAEVEALASGAIARSTLALAREREGITTRRVGQQWVWTPPKRRTRRQFPTR